MFIPSTQTVYNEPAIINEAIATTTATTTESSEVAEEAVLEVKNTPKEVQTWNSEPDITNTDYEALIAFLGANHPLLNVSKCESGYRQFNSDGSLLRGRINSQDVGIFQINEGYHLAAATAMGLDIHTLEGNMAYALHLYETQGLTPWNWSKHCWN